MLKLTTTLRHALLACALAFTSIAAHAGVLPTYKVTINTAAASGAGFLDFEFAQSGGSPTATATISNLVGAAFTIETNLENGTVTDLGANSFAMLNDASYRSLSTQLGGMFTFDLAFSGDFLDIDSLDISMFTITAFDKDSLAIGGQQAVQFSLYSPQLGAPAKVEYNLTLGIGNVEEAAEVPEPSELLLVLTGLGMVGLLRRRRASAK